MGKKRRKRKAQKRPSGAPQKKSWKLKRFWKICVVGVIAVLFGIFANLVTILDFLGLSPKEHENPAWQNPTPPSYVLYEELPDLTWSSALYNQGIEAYAQGNYSIAQERFEGALAEYKLVSHADVDTAKIQYSIGILYKRLGNLDMAIQWFTDAIGTLKSLPDTEDSRSELGYVHYLRGFAYLKKRDLPRALLDCDECSNIAMQDIENKGFSSTSAALYLRGEIYTASFYGMHSPYPVHGGTDLGVTWLDAMGCYESALQYRGAELTYGTADSVSSDVIAVNAYNDYGISLMSQLLQYNDKPIFSATNRVYYIIHRWNVETAVILTSRAQLLSMTYTDAYLSDAIENCNAALRIYESLPVDEREGIQETYWLLANAILTKNALQDDPLSADTLETYCQLMEEGLMYTKKWYGESYATAVAYENMGYALMVTSQYDDATENFKEAQRIFAALGLEQDVEKQNSFLETVEKCIEAGDTDGEWEIRITDDFGTLIPKY